MQLSKCILRERGAYYFLHLLRILIHWLCLHKNNDAFNANTWIAQLQSIGSPRHHQEELLTYSLSKYSLVDLGLKINWIPLKISLFIQLALTSKILFAFRNTFDTWYKCNTNEL